MKMQGHSQRLRLLVERLQSGYESLGHSSKSPYLYFVYDPDDNDQLLPEILKAYLHEDEHLSFVSNQSGARPVSIADFLVPICAVMEQRGADHELNRNGKIDHK